MENAVIYARYSSHSQTEATIEKQIEECKKYAEARGFRVIGEYVDRAKSATTDDRPEFLRMISDAEQKISTLFLFISLTALQETVLIAVITETS